MRVKNIVWGFIGLGNAISGVLKDNDVIYIGGLIIACMVVLSESK